jgi:hypothetical protein
VISCRIGEKGKNRILVNLCQHGFESDNIERRATAVKVKSGRPPILLFGLLTAVL